MTYANALEILRTKYLISKIKFEGIHRREILEYPYEALREAIINALIHRNYLGTSSIQIRVYSDRLVIMNEGKLSPEVPVEKLKIEHLSKPRNTLLADVFYKAGSIESWERGAMIYAKEKGEALIIYLAHLVISWHLFGIRKLKDAGQNRLHLL